MGKREVVARVCRLARQSPAAIRCLGLGRFGTVFIAQKSAGCAATATLLHVWSCEKVRFSGATSTEPTPRELDAKQPSCGTRHGHSGASAHHAVWHLHVMRGVSQHRNVGVACRHEHV